MDSTRTVKAKAEDVLAWMTDWFRERIQLEWHNGVRVNSTLEENLAGLRLIIGFELEPDFEALTLKLMGTYRFLAETNDNGIPDPYFYSFYFFKLFRLGPDRTDIRKKLPIFHFGEFTATVLAELWNEIDHKFETIKSPHISSIQKDL
ncbi:MAG: hypothetical protein NTW32_27075 [Chloroflexi bacterium]|nr:hypothetical protein [Chloroflexota bacterium]